MPVLSRGRARLLAAGLAIAVVGVAALLAVGWRDRAAVGGRLAVDYLRWLGVPARMHLTRIGRAGAEGSLEIGAPGRPTLRVDRFRAAFAPGRGVGVPQVRRLDLDGVTLSAAFDGRRIRWGALQPLVDRMARAPKGAGPGPDIGLSRGRLLLATPYGPLDLAVDAALSGGRVRQARLTLAPAQLRSPGGDVQDLRGWATLTAAGADRVRLHLDAGAAAAAVAGATSEGLHGVADAEVAGELIAGRPTHAPAAASLRLSARRLGAGQTEARGADARLDLAGVLDGPTLAFSGRGGADVRAQDGVGPGIRVAAPRLTLTAPHLDLAADGDAIAAGALGLEAPTGAARVGGETVALSRLAAVLHGDLGLAPRRPATARLHAALSGEASLPPERAAALGRRLLPGEGLADLRAALARAGSRIALSAPDLALAARDGAWTADLPAARLQGGGGARLSLSGAVRGGRLGLSGQGAAILEGGGLPEVRLAATRVSAGAGRASGTLHLAAAGSAGPVRGVRLDAQTQVEVAGRQTRVTLDRCAEVALDRVADAAAKPLAQAASVRLCPAPAAPLLAMGPGGARVAADLRDLALEAPGAGIALAGAAADVRLATAGRGRRGEIRIAQAILRDTAAPRRFGTLDLAGAVRLDGDRVDAEASVAAHRPARPLGTLSLRHDLRTQTGRAEFQAPHLDFAPSGLQPAAVLPGLAALGRDVTGPAQVSAMAAWRGGGLTETVHVATPGLQVRTAAGLLTGLRTDLTLTGLDPLVSPPGQRVEADRLEAVVPLTGLAAVFTLGGGGLDLGDAHAGLAGGRIALAPMQVPLKPHAALRGAVEVERVQLAPLLDALTLSRALTIDASVSGTLPFALDAHGLQLAGGRLAADGPGRLTLHRSVLTGVAGGGVAASSSVAQDFAFQALEDLAFTELDATVATRAGGRLGVRLHVKGRHDPAVALPARIGLFDLLRGHALDKPIPLPKGTEVNLTLDSSLNLDDLLAAYPGLSPDAGSAKVQP